MTKYAKYGGKIMYTMTLGYKKKSRGGWILTTLTALFIAFFLICSSVKLILNAKFLYYFDIDYLKIAENYDMDKSTIKDNYDILINYLEDKNIEELSLPDFEMSPQGKIHFEEVKIIFTYLDYLLYLTLALSLICIIIQIIKRQTKFLKIASIALILLPILLAIPFAINFDATFTIFHKIFFNNDYWIFDPQLDPVINILPQEFFMHAAIGILTLLVIFSILLYAIYRALNKGTKKDDFIF